MANLKVQCQVSVPTGTTAAWDTLIFQQWAYHKFFLRDIEVAPSSMENGYQMYKLLLPNSGQWSLYQCKWQLTSSNGRCLHFLAAMWQRWRTSIRSSWSNSLCWESPHYYYNTTQVSISVSSTITTSATSFSDDNDSPTTLSLTLEGTEGTVKGPPLQVWVYVLIALAALSVIIVMLTIVCLTEKRRLRN